MPASENLLAEAGDHCYLSEAAQENKEVVPVIATSTGVLLSAVTVGR